MNEWLNLFNSDNDEIILILDGKEYKKNSCALVGQGSEKRVFQLADTEWCFFVPNNIPDSEQKWNTLIGMEKKLLDLIDSVGLKTQRFTITTLEIKGPENQTHSMNVLLTKNFSSLCKTEQICIYVPKGNEIIGSCPKFTLDAFDREKMRKMIRAILYEYAIALTYAIPIRAAGKSLDDMEHLYFQLPVGVDEPPTVHYMFWDVVGEFSTLSMPHVPNLTKLKSGGRDPNHPGYKNGLGGIKSLANFIACGIAQFLELDALAVNKAIYALENKIVDALDDDLLLAAQTQARIHAKNNFQQNLRTYVETINKNSPETTDNFVQVMNAAISMDDVNLVAQVMKEAPHDLHQLTDTQITRIAQTAQEFANDEIIGFIKINLSDKKAQLHKLDRLAAQKQQLRSEFFEQYQKKLTADKMRGCRLYSFFVKSFVSNEMTLDAIVNHAKGLSNQGTGQRSNEVLKKLGWLDEHNQETDLIKPFLAHNPN
ncbi:MAG: hypothetical protein J0I93_02475 [Legionella sp.]|nr:hypothetical protein [Legionella sp.]